MRLQLTLATFVVIAQCPAQVGWVPARAFSPEAEFAGLTDPAQLASDRARGRLVSFGACYSYGLPGTTWEWGGTDWTLRDGTGPTPRKNGVLVYDELRQRTVLFGGAANSLFGDTWEWDGTAWSQVTPTHTPSARHGAAAAFHAGIGKIVMFGGRTPNAVAETWTYDGVDWVQLNPQNSPPPLWRHRLVYDRARAQIVLAGGGPQFGPDSNQTWAFDGTNWTLAATGAPSGLEPAFVYDEVQGVSLFFGGSVYHAPTPVSAWDGQSWQTLGNTPFVAPQQLPAAASPDTGSALAFAAGKVWQWNGNAFQVVAAASSGPAQDYGVLAATDTIRGRVVLGGNGTLANQRLTWEWDGSDWQRLSVTTPALGRSAAMAFDSASARTVVFGGYNSSGAYLNTGWVFDGTTWSGLPATGSVPPGRADHGLAYDEARNKLVLFGGFQLVSCAPAVCPTFYGDTWLHDGLAWTQAASGPSARAGCALAYDPLRQVTVLFGGSTGAGLLGDTWEWNGSAWAQVVTPLSPAPRGGARMVFAPLRGTMVLYGGGTATTVANDLWEYDGLTWIPIASNAIPPRSLAALVIDPASQRVMLHGGMVPGNSTSTVARLDTWMLDVVQPAQTSVLGAGCVAAGGTVPALSSDTPYLNHGAFRFELRDLAPSALAVFGIATQSQAVSIGLCTVYVANPVVALPFVANQHGVAVMPLPLPNVAGLLGQTFAAQAVTLGSPGAQFGLDFSNGWQFTFGN